MGKKLDNFFNIEKNTSASFNHNSGKAASNFFNEKSQELKIPHYNHLDKSIDQYGSINSNIQIEIKN